FDRLNVVAQVGHFDEHDGRSDAGDVGLVLPGAHRLDQHDVVPEPVGDRDEILDCARQATYRTTGRDAANVCAAIAVKILHADAVAEDRTSGDRTRRIDGKDGNRLTALADHSG